MRDRSNSSNNQPVEPLPDDVALRERVEKRAYHIWLASGGGHGEHLRHWLQAEGEVLKALHQEHEEQSAVRRTKSAGKQRTLSKTNVALSNK